MKLLIDSMYPPFVAEQLRLRGHDVIAARALPDLVDKPDRDLLTIALRERRVIVSENLKDFLNLDAELRQQGREHSGIILTTDRQFPRRRGAGMGRLVTALDAWLHAHPEEATPTSAIWWL